MTVYFRFQIVDTLVANFMCHYVNRSESGGGIRLALLIRDTELSDYTIVNVSANASDSGQT
jgi:hypothetical protein